MTRTVAMALLLLAGCTALEELGSDAQSLVETDFTTTTRGTTSTTSAPDFFEERCKVIDDDFATEGHWEVSCRLELDWGGESDMEETKRVFDIALGCLVVGFALQIIGVWTYPTLKD